MSQFPKKYHGSELKCGGPQMCSDCKERLEHEEVNKIVEELIKELPTDPSKLPWENFNES